MPDFDLIGELSLKIELHMLRPITEKVHSGNGPVSLVQSQPFSHFKIWKVSFLFIFCQIKTKTKKNKNIIIVQYS